MSDVDNERRALQARLAVLDDETKRRKWAETTLASYSRTDKERLLRYLIDWRKSVSGHDADCTCGECD